MEQMFCKAVADTLASSASRILDNRYCNTGSGKGEETIIQGFTKTEITIVKFFSDPFSKKYSGTRIYRTSEDCEIYPIYE